MGLREVNISVLLGLVFIWGCEVVPPADDGTETVTVTGQVTIPSDAESTLEYPAAVVLMGASGEVTRADTDMDGLYNLGTQTTSTTSVLVAQSLSGDYGAIIPFTAADTWETPKALSGMGSITGTVTLSGDYYRKIMTGPNTVAASVQIVNMPSEVTGALAGKKLLLATDAFTFDAVPAGTWSLVATADNGTTTVSETIEDVTPAAGTVFSGVDFHLGGDVNNSTLAELNIDGFELFVQTSNNANNNFDSSVLEYNATHSGYEVTFYAIAEDANATIQVRQDANVLLGPNTRQINNTYTFPSVDITHTIIIRVTPTNGNSIDYTINLTVSAGGLTD